MARAFGFAGIFLFPESPKNKRLSTGQDRAGSASTMAALCWFIRVKRLSSLPASLRAPSGRPALGYGRLGYAGLELESSGRRIRRIGRRVLSPVAGGRHLAGDPGERARGPRPGWGPA